MKTEEQNELVHMVDSVCCFDRIPHYSYAYTQSYVLSTVSNIFSGKILSINLC